MCDESPLRLFVAWNLPDDGPGRAHREAMVNLQRSIDAVIPPLSARWEPAEKLHITLRFIGEFPCERYDELVSTLSDSLTETAQFLINFDQVLLHFGRMIWLEPSHNLELITALHNSIDLALAPFELKPGLRFAPHITLARLRHNAPSRTIAGQMSPFRYPQLPPVQVANISLMSSHFHPAGNTHHVEHNFELNAT
ncbi:MAG: RNA 2',3'-cyclic phosphodiesterase [Armatimonadota bacterium]